MSAQLLSAEQIKGRLQPSTSDNSQSDAGAAPTVPTKPMEYFTPTSSAVDDYVHYLNSDTAFQTGFKPIDLCFPSGLDRGDMFLLTGRSHQGKSTVAYNMMVHNLKRSADFTCVFYSPDEPRELVVQKLACIAMGRNAADMEEALREGSTAAERELRNVAGGLLDRVLINDQSLTFASMLRGIHEAEQYWGRQPSACVLDFLELMVGDADANGVAGKAQSAKRFAKDADVPLIVLHQTGRGAGARGGPAGIHGGRFGGEAESVAVLECYRPKDAANISDREKATLENVIQLNLCKNKRPPYRCRDAEMIMDPNCGQIREPTVDDYEDREWGNF